ncbi:hypothetical protein [Sebaldella sp. S0638]|uniref:hypothetical protein n=1 Tax=Sebaldella sp. S0638 TaxID=2957809 RepID=UPI0020A102E0|nr:hypothetical protein [Sebaldella sp. S0638]MCP1226517.1 hypothetical protein [Sebaldella sp. S0638]
MKSLKFSTLEKLALTVQQINHNSYDIAFLNSIINEYSTYVDSSYPERSFDDILEDFTLDRLEFSVPSPSEAEIYEQRILAISIIILLSCTSYSDSIIEHIFQYLASQGKDFATGFIICWISKTLFPNFSDKITLKFNEYFKK